MNLLESVQEYIKFHQIKNKLEIARYLYIRTGELFEYDPFYAFANSLEAKIITKKKFDKKNIKEFYFTCTSWAYLYKDLLHAFNIPAKVVETESHVYVKIFIDGEVFLADITNNNEDLMRIKFKLKTLYQRRIAPIAPKVETIFDEMDENTYRRGRKTEIGIHNVSEYLMTIKLKLKNEKINYQEDYLYTTFKIIEQMLPSYKVENLGVVSGTKFIDYLLTEFKTEYPFSCTRLYDRDTRNCSQIYTMKRNGKEYFFSYNQVDGQYLLQEKKKDEILSMETPYTLKLIYSKQNNKLTNQHSIMN